VTRSAAAQGVASGDQRVRALRVLAVDLGGVVFLPAPDVDDERNVAAARSLGLRTVHFRTPEALSEVDAEVRRVEA